MRVSLFVRSRRALCIFRTDMHIHIKCNACSVESHRTHYQLVWCNILKEFLCYFHCYGIILIVAVCVCHLSCLPWLKCICECIMIITIIVWINLMAFCCCCSFIFCWCCIWHWYLTLADAMPTKRLPKKKIMRNTKNVQLIAVVCGYDVHFLWFDCSIWFLNISHKNENT